MSDVMLEKMPWSPRLMRAAAIASILSVASTMILIFGSQLYPQPDSFADRVALADNAWFKLRAWTSYVHPFLCMLAAIGVWRVARRYEPAFALVGILAMGAWAYTEALQIALTNVGALWNWFPVYRTADVATKATIEERWTMFYGLWDGLFFLLLSAYLIASLMLGSALVRGERWERVIGIGFLAISAVTLDNFFAGYGGPAWTGTLADWLYPIIQLPLRFGVGFWLWWRATID